MSDAVLAVTISGAFTFLGIVATTAVALRTNKSTTETAEKKIEAESIKERLEELREEADRYRTQMYEERERGDTLQKRVYELEDRIRKLETNPHQLTNDI